MGVKGAKGQPKTPGSGRRKGVPNRATERHRRLLALVEANDDAINAKVIEEAKSGANWQATALYYKHLRPPPPRLSPTPLIAETPTTIEQVRVLCAELAVKVLAGVLDTDAAQVAATLLKSVESSIVSHDLAELLARLQRESKT
jgi:hypothetical protein